MPMKVELYKLYKDKGNKKFKAVVIENGKKIKSVKFGDNRYEDFTQHGDNYRRGMYLSRHMKGQNWSKKGITTAGWWSRWLLWEKDSIPSAIRNIERKFNIDIVYKV